MSKIFENLKLLLGPSPWPSETLLTAEAGLRQGWIALPERRAHVRFTTTIETVLR